MHAVAREVEIGVAMIIAWLVLRGFLALALLAAAPARAEERVGVVSVIDGDTLDLHGERIRMHGIDAPESCQTCINGSMRIWRCGQTAALELDELIARRPVRCEGDRYDGYGRLIARCTVDDVDLGEWLVSAGLALAYRKFSMDYVGVEAVAMDAQRGMWAGEFDPPWLWRQIHGPCGRR